MFLKAENLSFGFDSSRQVLNGISFELKQGETIAIVGASGCGKSTLLRILAGILPSTKSNHLSGTIAINGKTAKEYLSECRLSFMFQEAALFQNLSVRENIGLPLSITKKSNPTKVSSFIERVGLKGFDNYLPKNLSGGMKTRVSLARSFITDPELLLLDEPFSAIDIGWKTILYEELKDIQKEQNTSVIMVTHDIQEAIHLADKIYVLGRNGIFIGVEIINSEPKKNFLYEISAVPTYYGEKLASIQKTIVNDAQRMHTTLAEALKILTKIETNLQDLSWEQISSIITRIRNFSHQEDVHSRLLAIYHRASIPQKFELMYDIFQVPNIPLEIKENAFCLIQDNYKQFANQFLFYYGSAGKDVDSVLFYRLGTNNERVPSENLWLYICQLPRAKDKERTIAILKEIENRIYPGVTDDFSVSVATKMLELVHEKN